MPPVRIGLISDTHNLLRPEAIEPTVITVPVRHGNASDSERYGNAFA